MRRGLALACLLVLMLVFTAGCLNLGMNYNIKVNKDAKITHAVVSLKMDRSTYNMLVYAAKQQGKTVQDMLQENLTASMGSGGKATYKEAWDSENNKVTLSFERTDTFSPPPGSKITVSRIKNQIFYEDNTFYSPQPPPSSPLFNQSQYEDMANMMLSGMTLDYYLEMPGFISDTSATTVKDNKAEWHVSGLDLTRTPINAISDAPMIPGFTSWAGIAAFLSLVALLGLRKKG